MLKIDGNWDDIKAAWVRILAMTPRERAENFLLSIGSTNHAPAYVDMLADTIEAAVSAERERCCKIIYGMCGSDNVAERTVRAIREG